jgi:spore coat polysaccharide biosynthesis protein SpsF
MHEMQKQRIVCIIQARMTSSRLPGKSMLPLGGKPLLQNVIERAKAASLVDEIVLATTDRSEEDVLADLGRKLGVTVFRGHPTDLLDRYTKASNMTNADIVVRIPADNPLIEPEEVDRIIAYFLEAGVDYACNMFNFLDSGYPDGLGAEIFSSASLEEMNRTVSDPNVREHIGIHFRDHPEFYRLGSVQCPKSFRRPDVILDINTPEDYQFIRKLYDDLAKPNGFINIHEILPWFDRQKKGNI